MLTDARGRVFPYLRLSLTEACNFKCTYCLPNGYKAKSASSDFLSLNEIENLVTAFAELGVKKVRLTGGEPTLRQDLTAIVRAVAQLVENVSLSTNGYHVRLEELKSAGLRGLNISLDSLNRDHLTEITGRDCLNQVLATIERALALGLSPVKLNVVLLKGFHTRLLNDFLDWVRERPVDVRFIELMRTQARDPFFEQFHLSPDPIKSQLCTLGWRLNSRQKTDGPAETYRHPDFSGRLGFIAPYAQGFCDSCNRLRVSARGGLRLCLWGEGQHSLRPWLQTSDQREKLKAQIQVALRLKPFEHRLRDGFSGDMASLSTIGG